MTNYYYQPARLAPALRAAFDLVAADLPDVRAAADPDACNLHPILDPAADCSFEWRAGQLTLRGRTVPQVLRALSLARGFAKEGAIPAAYVQPTTLDSIGLMLDASRNAVPTPETVKLILRKMAMLGMNLMMLYTEDTYEVPDQPLIGYLRGRYSQAEMRELDDYAAKLGIEIVPCIQALAHLEQMLRWPAFAGVCDTSDILLVDEPKTYELLEQMLTAASAPFRTKRIHLGMDEAHNIGLGRYRQLHGTRSRFEILSGHLQKVNAICLRHGLRPMIWSDMYFRLAASDGGYYSADSRISPEIASGIPAGLQLVYWDYYHTDPAFYADWIDRHRIAGNDTLFASGLWTWNTFWINFTFTRVTAEAGVRAAKERGLKEIFTTAWGDDGAEADFLSILPGLTLFASNAYSGESVPDDKTLEREFRGAIDADWKAWRLNGQLDETPGLPTIRDLSNGAAPTDVPPEWVDSNHVNWSAANVAKTLLWQDPLLGIADGNVRLEWGLSAHYRQLADALATVDDGWHRAAFPRALANALAEKADLGVLLLHAYQGNDRPAMRELCEVRLPRALAACEALHEAHRRLWHAQYKPFGWEVLDGRYGALEARLRSTRARVQAWLHGDIDRIEELDPQRLPVMPWPKGKLGASKTYRTLISPSTLT